MLQVATLLPRGSFTTDQLSCVNESSDKKMETKEKERLPSSALMASDSGYLSSVLHFCNSFHNSRSHAGWSRFLTGDSIAGL